MDDKRLLEALLGAVTGIQELIGDTVNNVEKEKLYFILEDLAYTLRSYLL